MDSKVVEEARKLQPEFSAKLAENADRLRAQKDLGVTAALELKERELSGAKSKLSALETEREAVLARLDSQLEKSRAQVKGMEVQLKELRERAKGPPGDLAPKQDPGGSRDRR